jgi:tetratricopeptide (TPR) repeat protein
MKTPIPTEDTVVEVDEIDAALFWHTHKVKIVSGVLAAIAIVGGSLAWYLHSTLTNEHAIEALATASDLPQLEAVVKNYGGTMPGADAEMLVAAEYQKAGKLDESTAAFQAFLKSYPKHPLAGGALLGIGQNQDAAGKPDEAIATYQQVVEKYPKSYAAPFASYAQSEILLRDFRRDEAKAVLDALVSEYPDSLIARLASAQISRLGVADAN